MNSRMLSASDLTNAVELLNLTIEAFADEEAGQPTLGEFLEILGLSVSTGNEHMSATPFPLAFKAKIKGNRWYKAEPSNRVIGLNDNVFAEASELLSFVVDRAATTTGEKVSPTELADYLHQVLQAAKLPFKDLASTAVLDLKVDAPKRIPQATVGDVVAIPATDPAGSGYHLAVVLANDQTGLALGLLAGVHSTPRVGSVEQYRARHIPIYTGNVLIKDGTWRIIDHREELLSLFPDPPELYWPAVTVFGDLFGEYGAAGAVDGPKRLIGKEEAEAVGLLNETYRQGYLEEIFQTILNKGQFDNGPLPGFWR